MPANEADPTEAAGYRHVIRDAASLQALYGVPGEASLIKETTQVHPLYAAFIEAAPFLVLATSGSGGLDASPRGDAAGLVEIASPSTLLLPDRRGNNRLDSLLNIVADPRVALLFLIPGVGETLRVNGRAEISVDPALLQRFTIEDKAPRTVLVINVESVYFQCSRAVLRAGLWNPERHVVRATLPSPGQILAALSETRFDGETYDRDLGPRVRATLY